MAYFCLPSVCKTDESVGHSRSHMGKGGNRKDINSTVGVKAAHAYVSFYFADASTAQA